MSVNSFYAELCSLAGTERKVQLNRARPTEPLKNGFVVAASPELVLLKQFHDFYPEGYSVVLTSDVTSVRSDEHERHWERMLRGEGIPTSTTLPRPLPMEDMGVLLTALMGWNENVVVQCEDADADIQDFYIGRILGVGGDTVAFSNFDALGRWNSEIEEILMEEVTQVELQTPYLQTFSRYVEGPCPHL